MTRQELKQLFFTLDTSHIPVRKQIIVETNYGHVEVLSDGPNGYSSFKTSQGDNCIDYGVYQKLEKPEYELIIDNTLIKWVEE